MRISVAVPAYNAAKTIRATVLSALEQTTKPFEVLVVDDGSSDDTVRILSEFGGKVHVHKQPNAGVAEARNALCRLAKGEVIAFLDSDDLWHASHLRSHLELLTRNPEAVAAFTKHYDFSGYEQFDWPIPRDQEAGPRLLPPVSFVTSCNAAPMSFQMSCCTVRKQAVEKSGREPFMFSGGEDTYFHHVLALLGEVCDSPRKTVAYRINSSSLSSNRIRVESQIKRAMLELKRAYDSHEDPDMKVVFTRAMAARQRLLGRLLMNAGQKKEARAEFASAIKLLDRPTSVLKSALLYISTYTEPRGRSEWQIKGRSSS